MGVAQREADAGDGAPPRERREADQGALYRDPVDGYAFEQPAPVFVHAANRSPRNAGTATLAAIEGLVELGMTPSQAIVVATKNGAIASRGLKDFGTLEAGKLGDSLILDADPIADIHNVRKLSLVMRDGRIIDRDKLPEKPVWTKRGKSDGGSGTAHRTDSGVLVPHSPSPIPHRQSPLPVGLPPHLPLTIRVALVLTTHMCDSHSLPSSKFGRPTQTARLTPAKQAARRRKPHQP